jgi:excisionase family DNA binding protein
MSSQGTTTRTPPLMSPAAVARLAHVSKATIYREIERGELRARHVGRQLRILPEDFDAYLDRGRAA